MARLWLAFCLVTLYFQSFNAFVLPVKNPDGTLNLEHLVGKMALLEQTVTSQNAIISALQGDVTRLNQTLSVLDGRSTGTVMTVASLSAKIVQLNTEVAFESWIGSAAVNVSGDSVIKFDNVQHNVGGGYNAITGVFTAPVAGRYLFWSQVEKISGWFFKLWIKKESQEIAYFFSPVSGYATNVLIASVGVNVGENVYVVTSGARSIQRGLNSRFGGVLLHRQ